MKNNQSGNMLIYILGAIALIGILIILVRGSSLPGAGIDNEAMSIKVSEVQQYGNELERAVRYILQSGYSELDIRFAHPNHSSAYGDITDDPARQVFTREGGGATWRDNDIDIQVTDTAWVFNISNSVTDVGTSSGTGDKRNELVAWLPYVSRGFCMSINEVVGIENLPNAPPNDINSINISDFYGATVTSNAQINASAFRGKMQGCMEGDASPPAGTYHYYRVLLAR